MIECRSNAISSDLLWGINLWQHERAFMKGNSHLKPTTQVLKVIKVKLHFSKNLKISHFLSSFDLVPFPVISAFEMVVIGMN